MVRHKPATGASGAGEEAAAGSGRFARANHAATEVEPRSHEVTKSRSHEAVLGVQMPFGESTTHEIERVASEIVDAAFKIHSNLGPGLLESAYAVIMIHEL